MLKSNQEAVELILEAISHAEFKAGFEIALAIDPAASEFFSKTEQKYIFEKSGGGAYSPEEMVNFWSDWLQKYPIISLEDVMAETDWNGWKLLTNVLGDQVQLIGDDIFVTNPAILAKGIEENVANAILIKLNQIGTVTETKHAMQIAEAAGYARIVSHRSGETEDSFIADFTVATAAGQIKSGSASRSDRLAKYNQLLRIEEELGARAEFAGARMIERSRPEIRGKFTS